LRAEDGKNNVESTPDCPRWQLEPLQQRPASPAPDPAPGAGDAASWPELASRSAVFGDLNLLHKIFSFLPIEEICRVASVNKDFYATTSSPGFWEVIDVGGRSMPAAKMCALLQRHINVRRLNASGVALSQANLLSVFPTLAALESLELEKAAYSDPELECIGGLPSLTRLVLAGGQVGSANVPAGGPAAARGQIFQHVRAAAPGWAGAASPMDAD
jgi:hypothetical protein